MSGAARIHPSAVVEDGAQIAPGCDIGPFCVIGPNVTLATGCTVKSHVVITGDTQIGPGCTLFPFAVVGEIPQDKKYNGEASSLRIGARTVIREHVTVNSGTAQGGGVTRVGDDCLLMAGCHIAHDAQVGNHVVVVNQAAIAGHVVLEDDVIVGGLSGVHQFVRVGQGAIIGACSMVTHDVLPFGLAQGPRAGLEGLNLVGLKRRGTDRAEITALRAAFQALRDGDGPFLERAARLREDLDTPYVAQIVDFVMAESDRGFLTPR